ncbi:MAG: hypothetical protein K0S48_2157 [Ramlibacter sp.]|nr:hypothetical protein [Ramlibacter sp.]
MGMCTGSMGTITDLQGAGCGNRTQKSQKGEKLAKGNRLPF